MLLHKPLMKHGIYIIFLIVCCIALPLFSTNCAGTSKPAAEPSPTPVATPSPTPGIHELLQNGDVNEVKTRVTAEADINETDENGKTLLHYAVMNNNIELAHFLVQNGAAIHIANNAGTTPFVAAFETSLSMLNAILTDGNCDTKDNQGSAPVHILSSSGDTESLRVLLDYDIDLSAENKNGRTALELALSLTESEAHARTAALLLRNGAELNTNSQFDFLAAYQNTGDIECLLEGGRSLLMEASRRNHTGFMKYFLSEGARVDRIDFEGKTAAHHAAAKKVMPAIQVLAENGADFTIHDFNGQTVLHSALKKKCPDPMIVYIIDKQQDVTINDNKGYSVLHTASAAGYGNSVLRALLDLGADLNRRTNEGRTPLLIAMLSNNDEAVSFLMQKNVDVFARDKDGISPAVLLANSASRFIPSFLEHNPVNAIDSRGSSILHEFVKAEAPAANINTIINGGVSINGRNNEGKTALHIAVQAGLVSQTAALIENGADLFILDADGLSPLVMIYRLGVAYTRKLIDNNPDEKTDTMGNTPLLQAVFGGFTRITRHLVYIESDIARSNKNGDTALHIASRSGNSSLVSILLQADAPVNKANKKGNTPLHEAVRAGNIAVVQQLSKQGADTAFQNVYGETALHTASRADVPDITAYLVSRGASVHQTDSDGAPPVFTAARFGSLDTLKVLFKHKADIFARDNYGNTALHAALMFEQEDTIKWLVNKGADIFASNSADRTPLSIAYEKGTQATQWLLDSGNINSRDNAGNTPLHYAGMYNAGKAVVDQLLQLGADRSARNRSGKQPNLSQ